MEKIKIEKGCLFDIIDEIFRKKFDGEVPYGWESIMTPELEKNFTFCDYYDFDEDVEPDLSPATQQKIEEIVEAYLAGALRDEKGRPIGIEFDEFERNVSERIEPSGVYCPDQEELASYARKVIRNESIKGAKVSMKDERIYIEDYLDDYDFLVCDVSDMIIEDDSQ